MQPATDDGESNIQCNVVYLNEGQKYPPLPVDGLWTYPKQTNFSEIEDDCLHVGCGPMRISAVCLVLRELRDSTVDSPGPDPRDRETDSDFGVEGEGEAVQSQSAVAAVPEPPEPPEPDPDPLNPTRSEEQICRLDHRLRFILEDLESGFRSLNHPKPFQAAKSLASQRLDLMVAEDMQKVKRQRRC